MAVDYALVIKSRAGLTQAILTGDAGGFRWLSYKKETNAPGLLMFDLDGGHALIDTLERDAQIEVWRRNVAENIAWYVDFYALFVNEERYTDEDGISTFRAVCPGQMDLLGRALVAWPANTANRSLFSAVKASTIMTNLVRYNVTSDATTGNGRIRTTNLSGITYETDDDDGNVMTIACAFQPLLEVLQDVARIGNRDFYLVKTGAAAWQFRTDNYTGLDRSATVVFSLPYGNMVNPILRRQRLNEKTVAIVGGQGEEADREFVVRTGTNYNTTYNSKEVFVPATQHDTEAGLQAAGDVRLEELRARDDLTWDVVQTPGSLYGVHYFVGDLVTGLYGDIEAVKQITAVTITFAPGGQSVESIVVETQTPYG